METVNQTFVKAIQEKIIVIITFYSKEKGELMRKCVPYDFGVGKRIKDKIPRYYVYNLDSGHNMDLLPEQIISIVLTEEKFNPADYVDPTRVINWNIPRNW